MVSFFHCKRQGRNNVGRITVHHRGSGARFFAPNFSYFGPNSYEKEFKLTTLEFPIISTNLYIKAHIESTLGKHYSVYFSKLNAGIPRRLFEFSIGQFLTDIELTPSRGPIFCRSFGSRCQLLKKRGTYAIIKFPSGEVRRLSVFCRARLWLPSSRVVSGSLTSSVSNTYKAGFNRYLGIRPHVRGCAINPVDHPHGGRTGDSRPSVSPWAQLTKGYRTRFRKVNKKFVLISVQNMKDRRRQLAS